VLRKNSLIFVVSKQTDMNNTYGIVNAEGTHYDVSKTEKGAKNYATRHGYTRVSIRYNGGCHCEVIAEKNAKGKWVSELYRVR
jgi:hypothetical protein